jgi:hypothetical protein
MILTCKKEQEAKDKEICLLRDQLKKCRAELESYTGDESYTGEERLLMCDGPACNEGRNSCLSVPHHDPYEEDRYCRLCQAFSRGADFVKC